jgi:hypothetical protein
MNTHFKRHEIIAYRKAFLYHTTRNLSPPQDGGEGKEGGEDKKGDDDSLDESGKGDGDNSDDKKSESSSSTTPSDSDDTTTTPPTDATSQAEAATTTATTKKSQVAPLASTLSFKSSNIPDLSEYPMSITRYQFLNIKSIAMNPLKERIGEKWLRNETVSSCFINPLIRDLLCSSQHSVLNLGKIPTQQYHSSSTCKWLRLSTDLVTGR